MAVILPVLAFLLICILLQAKRQNGWRLSLIKATLIWSLLLAILTESLSFFRLINYPALSISWGLIGLITLGLLSRQRGFYLRDPRSYSKKLIVEFYPLIVLITLILCLGLLTGLISSPNNWDSMTYHLGRVEHWIQNQSVAHYPTNIDRQISQNPLAEYIILHFQILSASDVMAALVQWFSFVVCIVSASLMVKYIGGSQKAQLTAAVFTALLPMGILQSSSTQNDLVLSAFIMSGLVFCVRINKGGKSISLDLLFAALALGLGFLTKGTAYIYFLPVFLWTLVRAYKAKKGLQYLLFSILFIIILNAGHFTRNYQTFGSPVGKTYGFAVEKMGARYWLSNAAKNTAIHFKTPWPETNQTISRWVIDFSDWLGVDINDPTLKWESSPGFHVGEFSTNEDFAGNPHYLILYVLTAFSIIIASGSGRFPALKAYLLVHFSMFFLFCLILKWQVWHCRLHLPLFVSMVPLLSIPLSNLKNKWTVYTILLLFALYSFPFVVYNQSRALFGKDNIFSTERTERYFINRPDLLPVYEEISSRIKRNGVTQIALITSSDSWEYPLWRMTEAMDYRRIEHILTPFEDKRLFFPDVIISFKEEYAKEVVDYQGERYNRMYSEAGIVYYVK